MRSAEMTNLLGATPDAIEALHLQGLVLFNLQLMMEDFAETLETVEILVSSQTAISEDPYGAFQSLTDFMQERGFRLSNLRYRHSAAEEGTSPTPPVFRSEADFLGHLQTSRRDGIVSSGRVQVSEEKGLREVQTPSLELRLSQLLSRREHNRVDALLQQRRSAVDTRGAFSLASNRSSLCPCCKCEAGSGVAPSLGVAGLGSGKCNFIREEDMRGSSSEDDVDGLLWAKSATDDVYSEGVRKSEGLSKYKR